MARPVFPGLIAELEKRDRIGWENHGRPLMTHDGTDPEEEEFEELLDALVYRWKARMERSDRRHAARVRTIPGQAPRMLGENGGPEGCVIPVVHIPHSQVLPVDDPGTTTTTWPPLMTMEDAAERPGVVTSWRSLARLVPVLGTAVGLLVVGLCVALGVWS